MRHMLSDMKCVLRRTNLLEALHAVAQYAEG